MVDGDGDGDGDGNSATVKSFKDLLQTTGQDLRCPPVPQRTRSTEGKVMSIMTAKRRKRILLDHCHVLNPPIDGEFRCARVTVTPATGLLGPPPLLDLRQTLTRVQMSLLDPRRRLRLQVAQDLF